MTESIAFQFFLVALVGVGAWIAIHELNPE